MQYKLYKPLSIHETGNRANQEDSLWPEPGVVTVDDRLFIVCDGMGGHEKGEVASQTICQELGRWFQDNAIAEEEFSADRLREGLEYAYDKLNQYDDGTPTQMGTTLTLLYLHRKGVMAAHIGDSRIYHIRPSKGLLYQSRDHSLVFDLFQAGEITYDQMGEYAKKNVITRALTPGKKELVRPDIINITDIEPNDWFYMCSDGMLEQMSSDELVALFSAEGSDEKKRQQLIAATLDNKDNHTAWLIHVDSVVNERGDEQLINEEQTARCNVLNIMRGRQQEESTGTDDDDDVVVVAEPELELQQDTFTKKKMPMMSKYRKWIDIFLKVVLALIIIALVIWGGLYFFKGKEGKTSQHRTSPRKYVPNKQHKKNNNDNTFFIYTSKRIIS